MRGIRAILLLTVLTLACGVATAAEHFPRPESIEPQVRFWRAIFGEYSKHQILVHDNRDLDKVYQVLDLRPYADGSMNPVMLERFEREAMEDALEEVRGVLLRLATMGPAIDGLTPQERNIRNLFGPNPSREELLEAADGKRLRTQRGLRERFGQGLRTAERYFPQMERIFRDRGLPVELTRLPMIESCFDVRAYSKVGAAGIWQFMPTTGRLYKLRVTRKLDERRDPIASTRGAARFFDELYGGLGTWPLAITAWNHGPAGMARAVRTVGSDDIGQIVQEYDGNAFGFASRNFYAEFLAALDVEEQAHVYFPEYDWSDPDGAARVQEVSADEDEEGAIVPAVVRDPVPVVRRRPAKAAARTKPRVAARATKTRPAKVTNPRPTKTKVQAGRPRQVAKLPDA